MMRVSILSALLLIHFVGFVHGMGARSECESCRKSYQCSTGKCFNRHCVYKDSSLMDSSKAKCFSRACDHCTSDYDCVTERCINNKCYDPSGFCDKNSGFGGRNKGKGSGKGSCAKCKENTDCTTGKCWGGRCVAGDSVDDKRACGFRDLCSDCTHKQQCMSFKCRGGLCVTTSNRCFGQPLCGHCEYREDCKEGFCFRNKCVRHNKKSKEQCGFARNCAGCHNDNGCISGRCIGGICASRETGLSKCH